MSIIDPKAIVIARISPAPVKRSSTPHDLTLFDLDGRYLAHNRIVLIHHCNLTAPS